MKLRSSCSTREETSFPNLVPATTAFADENSPMSKALRNPLILDVVFAKLTTSELKMARLVCREWGDAGAGLLGKRALLDVNKLFRCDGPRLYQATPVHDQLTRGLRILDKFDPSVPTKRTDDVIAKVFTELNVSQVTREIEFHVSRKKFVAAFLHGLRTLKSTKIQQISIFVTSRNANVDKGRSQVLQKLPVQRNLTSIKFQIPLRMLYGTSGIHAFQPLLQTLIDSAPTLTSLDVTASFCPSLKGCTNLQILKFLLVNCHHVACPDFNLATVTSMLHPMKDSLIKLDFGYADAHENYIYYPVTTQGRNLDVPVVTNLTSLIINAPSRYLIFDFFDEEHLPKLKTLCFKNHYLGRTSLSTHLNLWKRHRGVQSFALKTRSYCQTEDKFGEQIVKLFPSVKKLELKLNSCHNCIKKLMESFQLWDLDEIKLVLEGENFAAGVVEVLRSFVIFKGIKAVHFEDAIINQVDFYNNIDDIILYSRGFKNVEISGVVVQEMVDVFRPIFEASGAPVNFKGGVFVIIRN